MTAEEKVRLQQICARVSVSCDRSYVNDVAWLIRQWKDEMERHQETRRELIAVFESRSSLLKTLREML